MGRGSRIGCVLLGAAILGLAPVRAGERSDSTPRWFGRTTPPQDDVFRFSNGAEPEVLDPALLSAQPDQRIAPALFEGLAVPDPQSLEPAPGVATRWEMSADGRTWTFHLRPDARWSNGERITARDFETSWLRVLHPDTPARLVDLFYVVRGARALQEAGDHRRVAGRDSRPRRLDARGRARGADAVLLAARDVEHLPPRARRHRGATRRSLDAAREPRRERCLPARAAPSERPHRARALRDLLGCRERAAPTRRRLRVRRSLDDAQPLPGRHHGLEPERQPAGAVHPVRERLRRLPRRAVPRDLFLFASTSRGRRSTTRVCAARSPWRSIATRSRAISCTRARCPGAASWHRASRAIPIRRACRSIRSRRDGSSRKPATPRVGASRRPRSSSTRAPITRRSPKRSRRCGSASSGSRSTLSNQEFGSYMRSDDDTAVPDRAAFVDRGLRGSDHVLSSCCAAATGNNRTGWSDAGYDSLLHGGDAGAGSRPAVRDAGAGRNACARRMPVPAHLRYRTVELVKPYVSGWYPTLTRRASAQGRVDRSRQRCNRPIEGRRDELDSSSGACSSMIPTLFVIATITFFLMRARARRPVPVRARRSRPRRRRR